MNFEVASIFTLLAVVMALFIWGRWRFDIVAFAALMAATVLGLVPAGEAFLGFGHPATVTVAAVLIISRALSNSGVVDMLTGLIQPATRTNFTHISAFSGLAALLSTVMNNVGALALMMPAAIQSALNAKRSPATILMPLSFASILGGLVTLIGTPPNIIVATYRADSGNGAFGMFDFTPVGGLVALAGIVFVTTIGWHLIPKARRMAATSLELFDMENYVTEMNVGEKSTVIGRSFQELEQEIEEIDAVLIGLARGNRFVLAARRDEILQPGDVLLVEAAPEALGRVADIFKLKLPGTPEKEAQDGEAEPDDRKDRLRAQDMTLMEAVVAQDSPLIGRTPALMRMRRRFGVNLLAVSRQGRPYRGRLRSFRFQVGDVMLLQGENDRLPDIIQELGGLPLAPRKLQAGNRSLAFATVALFAAAVTAATTGFISLPIAFGIAALGMIGLGSVPLRDLYESVDWPVIVLLGAMIPVGQAMETTGAASLLAEALVSVTSGMPAAVTLLLVMIVTMVMTDVMNNAATALVMAPIAAGIAAALGVNPDTFLMAVAVAASCAFLTPIGHQNNALILGPGGYKFSDYWRMGLPLDVVILCVALPALLYFWPL
jgi:di/tricarboxylate transporter